MPRQEYQGSPTARSVSLGLIAGGAITFVLVSVPTWGTTIWHVLFGKMSGSTQGGMVFLTIALTLLTALQIESSLCSLRFFKGKWAPTWSYIAGLVAGLVLAAFLFLCFLALESGNFWSWWTR